jgi:hypothetical protein
MEGHRSSIGVTLTGGLTEAVTPWAGAALLVELYRKAGVEAAVERALPGKKSAKGLRQGEMVESFVLLSALGGDCIEDMERLRQDEGLRAMLGYCPSAPETARQWLDKFHEDSSTQEQPRQGSLIAREPALAGLKEPNRQVIWTYVDKLKPGLQVTLDVDAHLVETAKANAKCCYEGYRAFQPMEVEWAETGLVLADEFREGNVYPGHGIKEIVDEAYDMLPPGSWRIRVRSDSAAYQQAVLDHWQQRGWQFAVSADMSRGLRKEIEALPQEAWKVWKVEKRGMIREWAEVPYVPTRQYERKDTQPYRYLAVRIRRQQGELFEDGDRVHHFAVVTNIWDMDGEELLAWQRGKAGTIEHIHHILDNELAGGVYPSAKHGANAAWLRLQVLTHNLLQLLKAVALPQEYANARPKRLRFAIFTQFGRVISHAGKMLLRIAVRTWGTLIGPAYHKILALGLPT